MCVCLRVVPPPAAEQPPRDAAWGDPAWSPAPGAEGHPVSPVRHPGQGSGSLGQGQSGPTAQLCLPAVPELRHRDVLSCGAAPLQGCGHTEVSTGRELPVPSPASPRASLLITSHLLSLPSPLPAHLPLSIPPHTFPAPLPPKLEGGGRAAPQVLEPQVTSAPKRGRGLATRPTLCHPPMGTPHRSRGHRSVPPLCTHTELRHRDRQPSVLMQDLHKCAHISHLRSGEETPGGSEPPRGGQARCGAGAPRLGSAH